MSRAKLAEELKRLLPDESMKRVRQAILLAYSGAAGVARGVRNEIDQENRLRTGILVNGQVNITSPTSATLTDWAWVIDFAVQQNNGQTFTILAPDAEFVRVDFFHGDNTGIIHYTPGIIDIEGNSIFPNIPQDHVILKKILRNPDGSNTEGPVDGSDSLITFIEDFVIPMTLGNKLVRSGLRKTADRFAFDGRVGGLPAVNADEFVTKSQLDQVTTDFSDRIEISNPSLVWVFGVSTDKKPAVETYNHLGKRIHGKEYIEDNLYIIEFSSPQTGFITLN